MSDFALLRLDLEINSPRGRGDTSSKNIGANGVRGLSVPTSGKLAVSLLGNQ